MVTKNEVKWIKIENADVLKDDSRIYWTGWIKSKGMNGIHGSYRACVKGNTKQKNCYQVPLINGENIEEGRKLIKDACNYYEQKGKWPQ